MLGGAIRYGGPDNQLVTDEFKIDWFTYLTSSENVIYAQVNRQTVVCGRAGTLVYKELRFKICINIIGRLEL